MINDLSKYINGVGIQESLLPPGLLDVGKDISADMAFLFSDPEYIAFCENKEKVSKEVNGKAGLFMKEWVAIINSFGPLEIPIIEPINIQNYKSLYESRDETILEQENGLNLSKEAKKDNRLQKDIYGIFKAKILLFYYDYLIRGCNEWYNYPYFKEQVKQYDSLWGEKNPEPIITDKGQIKAQGLRDMVSYGYDEIFFAQYDQIYDSYEKDCKIKEEEKKNQQQQKKGKRKD